MTTITPDRIGTVTNDPTLLADGRALSDAVGDLIRVVQFRDRDRACCYDLSVSQFYALKAVAEGGPLTVNDLAARLYLDKSTASRVANGLEEKAYLKRRRDPEDGRVIRLHATDQGTMLCQRIDGDLASEYAGLLADLSPEVRDGVTWLVGQLTRSFSARVDASGGSCCVVS
jgi:DNA-binding MarR family transcriptional regulator